MVLLDVREARDHGRGIQVYLKDSQVNDSAFPITGGDEVICQTIPGQALVLLPLREFEYPRQMTLREPPRTSIDPGVDPANLPFQMEATRE